MADMIVRARPAGATVLALVGNAHAMLTPVPWGTRYLPMAAHLPREEVRTFNMVGLGGEAWTCQGAPVVCGVNPNGPARTGSARGVALGAGDEAYSGVIQLGTPTTASPPKTGAG